MTRSRDVIDWVLPSVLIAALLIISGVSCGISKERGTDRAMSIYAQERYQAGYLQALRDTGAAPAPMGGAK